MKRPEAVTFPVPAHAGALEITHGVCGMHRALGPMLLRWQRRHISNEEILAKLAELYGGLVYGIQFIAVRGEQIKYMPRGE